MMNAQTLAQHIEQQKLNGQLFLKYLKQCKKTTDLVDASRMLTILVQMIPVLGFQCYIDQCFDVAQRFTNQEDDEIISQNIDYVYLNLYFFLGFYPNTIEYGLRVIDNGRDSMPHVINAYNYMAAALYHQEFYDLAEEYFNKAYQLILSIEQPHEQQILTEISHYQNLVQINLQLNKLNQAKQYASKGRALVEASSDLPLFNVYNLVQRSSELFIALKENLKNVSDEFVEYMHSTMDNILGINDGIVTFEDYLPFIEKLIEEGRDSDALQCCNYFLNSKIYYGNRHLLYHLILEIYKKSDDQNAVIWAYDDYVTELQKFTERYHQILRYVTEDKFRIRRIEEQYKDIKERSMVDTLTLSYNRSGLETTGNEFYNKTPSGTVVFIDLNGLKRVNDTYGHQFGDKYLREFARNLLAEIGKGSHLYRYGGDEFVILSEYNNERVTSKLDDIQKSLDEGVVVGDLFIAIPFSYGITSFNEENKPSLKEIIAVADKLMYIKKKS